jgi:hypothetical protein
MIVQKDILLEMLEFIEFTTNLTFWKAFIEQGDAKKNRASEYELYARYSLYRYPERTFMRLLPYFDVGNCSYTDEYVYYTSCHDHLIDLNVTVEDC